MALAAIRDFQALVNQPLLVHALRDPRLVQQVDRALLQHAGADAAQYVFARATLEDDRLHPLEMQQL